MRYYCNICKKTITKGEFLYSIDKFDRPLCREHQEIEKNMIESNNLNYHEEHKQEIQDKNQIQPPDEIESGWKKTFKKIGKGIVKGAKAIADSTKKTMQMRRWKEDILRRMSMNQLRQLCFENRLNTKKNILRQDGRSGKFYTKTINCTKVDLVHKLKNKAGLDYLINFSKRNHINIRDILRDIDRKKAEWKVKEITENMKEGEVSLFLEVEKAVREFKPLRKYDKELYYQDSLASWLKSKFPNTAIEVSRGSTRPDIVVEGIAIEVKGPTYDRDLQTISDKCMRYCQYFPQGLICVLFNVYVNHHRYKDWEKGMKETFPNVKIIKI